MRVVLETSAVVASSFELSSPSFRNVLAHSDRLGYQLLMPRVVQGELINRFEKKIWELHDQVVSAIAEFERMTGYEFRESMTKDIVTQAVHDYSQTLEHRFTRAGGTFLEYPSVGHEDLARMDMKDKKPFGGSKPSYRDALIWFTILEALRQRPEPLIFITSNTKDFSESKSEPSTLHHDLAEQLRLWGMKGNEVEIILSIEEFNQRIIVPLLDVDEELTEQIRLGRLGQLDLRQQIRSRFDDGLGRLIPMMNPLVLSIPRPVASVRYAGIGDIEITESQIKRIGAEDLWASLRISFPVNLIVETEMGSPLAQRAKCTRLLESGLVEATLSRPGFCSVEMIVRPREDEISSLKILMLQVGKWAVGIPNASAEEYFESVSQFALGFGDTDEEQWVEQTWYPIG